MRRLLFAALLAFPACDDAGSTGGDAAPPPGQDAALDLDAGAPDAAPPDARPLRDLRVPVDMGAPDEGPPGIRHVWVGVNEIAEDLLGFEPAEGRRFEWSLPPAGWTVNVVVEHGPDWAPAETPYVLWRFVSPEGEPIPLDASSFDPPGGIWEEVEKGHRWRARVVEPVVPEAAGGVFTLETVVDGNVSRKLRFSIIEPTPEALPFDQGIDHWVVSFDRDRGRFEVIVDEPPAPGTPAVIRVESADEPDGVPDFVEAMEALALLGGDEAWDAALLAALRARIRRHLHAFFSLDPDTGAQVGPDSVPIAFHFHPFDPELPPPEEWAALGWSRIAVGGEDPRWAPGGRTFFGRADLDWQNAAVNDNTTPDRGIFTTGLARFVLANTFTLTLLRDYLPALEGAPFGSQPGDARFLEPGFDAGTLEGDAQVRAGRFALLFDSLALALASITAHEIGHSLGLVKPGFPPHGLLAEVEGPWRVRPAESAHIDTAGFNLMQTGSSFDFADALDADPRFNGPNMAYLRGRIVVLPGAEEGE